MTVMGIERRDSSGCYTHGMVYYPRLHMSFDVADLVALTYAELQAVPFLPNGTTRRGDVAQVIDFLEVFNMGVYAWRESPEGAPLYLIGFKDAAAQHPHDRWVWRSTRSLDPTWLFVPAEANAVVSGGYIADLLQDMRHFQGHCEDIQQNFTDGAQQSHEVIARLMMLFGLRDFGMLEFAAIGDMGHPADFTTLHLLLNHWPAYLKDNPEAVDMPKALVLRMHGLGPWLDHKREVPGGLGA